MLRICYFSLFQAVGDNLLAYCYEISAPLRAGTTAIKQQLLHGMK